MSSVNLSGNIYVNFILSVAVEIPSYLFVFFFIDRLGRKPLLVVCQCLAGVSCMVAAFIPKDIVEVVTTLTLIGIIDVEKIICSFWNSETKMLFRKVWGLSFFCNCISLHGRALSYNYSEYGSGNGFNDC